MRGHDDGPDQREQNQCFFKCVYMGSRRTSIFFSSGFEELNVSFILVAPSICTCELCNCSVIHEMFNHPYFELKENKYLLFHMRQSSKICICLHHFCCCSWGDKECRQA